VPFYSTTLVIGQLIVPPGGSFANTLACTVAGMVAGAALGFLILIAAVILLIAASIYTVFRFLL